MQGGAKRAVHEGTACGDPEDRAGDESDGDAGAGVMKEAGVCVISDLYMGRPSPSTPRLRDRATNPF